MNRAWIWPSIIRKKPSDNVNIHNQNEFSQEKDMEGQMNNG